MPGHCQLTEAVRYEAFERRDMDSTAILEDAFYAFNEGRRTDPVVDRYREAGNRSLSVGDLVEINGRRWVCLRSGWELVGA